MVHEVLSQIYQRLERAKKTGEPVNMSMLYRAATHDLIADYAFGQGSICFSREDLNQPYFQAHHEMVLTWYVGCYMPWFGWIVRRLPVGVVKVLVPTVVQFIDMIQVRPFPLTLAFFEKERGAERLIFATGSNRTNQQDQRKPTQRRLLIRRPSDHLPRPPLLLPPRLRESLRPPRRRSIRAPLRRH